MAIVFKVKQQGVWNDKSQFIQIPINIIQTLDETMDRGEITLNFTQDENAYEPYDFAYLEIDGKEYYMMIESDEVEELIQGLTSFYKHSITLIEATQYLATLDLNDFSITQELEFYSGTQYSLRSELLGMKSSDTFAQRDNTPEDWRTSGTAFTFDDSFAGTNIRGGIYKVNLDIGTNTLKSLYNKDVTSNNFDLYLPIPDIKSATFFTRAELRSFGLRIGTDEAQFNLSYTETLVNKTTNQTYFVQSLLVDPFATTNRRVLLTNLPAGNYVYKIRTNASFWDVQSNYPKLNEEVLDVPITVQPTFLEVVSSYDYAGEGGIASGNILIDYEYPFTVADTATINFNKTLSDALIKALNNISVRKLEDGRYWRSISLSEYNSLPAVVTLAPVFQTFPEPNVAFGSARAYEYTTRAQIILTGGGSTYYRVDSQLINPIVGNPIDLSQYDNTFKSNVFYTKPLDLRYDEAILNKASALTSLDFTFAGGKNLLEVLFELGKPLGGIPRVYFDEELNPVISFDILNEIAENINFDDSFTTMTKIANTSSYATNLITELKNAVISDDIGLKSANTIVYPSKNSWITPRAQDYASALMRPDTMTLAIDDSNHGIYDLVKLEVRNFDPAIASMDISEYVHEKTIYDSYPNSLPLAGDKSLAHKGIALYFTRADNFIENIGQIPTPDNIFGAEGELYTIERIIQHKARRPIAEGGLGLTNYTIPKINGSSISKLTYEFRVEYVPIIKAGRVYAEQSNVTLENKSVSMPFNQTERNTVLPQFFQAADNALKRNGIPSITKNYIFNTIEEVPNLGQRIDFDGYDYYVDRIALAYENNNVACEVQYSRDINKVDPIIGFNKEYREYSLAQDNIVWKRVNINNYIYLTEDNRYVNVNFNKPIFPKAVANSLNTSQYSSEVEKLRGAVFNFYDINAKKITYEESETGTFVVKPVGMTLLGAAAGNSLMFTTSMYDNFSAGRSVERIAWSDGNEKAITDAGDAIASLMEKDPVNTLLEKNRVKQNFIRYVDDNGEVGIMNILFLKDSDTTTFNSLTVPQLDISATQYKNLTNSSVLNELVFVDKDNREGIQFTYQLHAISRDKNIDIRPAFMKYNKLVTDVSKYPFPPGAVAMVGVEDMVRLRNQKFYDYDPADVISAQVFVLSGSGGITTSQVGLIGNNATNNKQKTYEGVALVFANTKEIVLTKRKPLPPGANIGPVYMTFSEEAL
jgi:hypothetical protein